MTKTSEEPAPRPMIGIFDSGVGGVTVADAIYRVLPDEDVVYLGDTARVPYGNKSPATVTRFTQDCTRYLMQHFPIKLMVIACNTASATALPHLGDIGVPVLGVIGTRTTIASGVYPAAIKAIAPDISTFGVACPLFVPLAEEGWGETEVARAAAERYLVGLRDADVDVIVLGCTHYPILKKTIQDTVGDGIKLVDSAEETAAAARWMLHQRDMLNPAGGVARRRYLLTDEPGEFLNVARRFLRDEGVVAEKVDV